MYLLCHTLPLYIIVHNQNIIYSNISYFTGLFSLPLILSFLFFYLSAFLSLCTNLLFLSPSSRFLSLSNLFSRSLRQQIGQLSLLVVAFFTPVMKCNNKLGDCFQREKKQATNLPPKIMNIFLTCGSNYGMDGL